MMDMCTIMFETKDTSEGAPFNVVMLLLLSQNCSVSRFLFLFYFSIPYTYFLMFAGCFVSHCLFFVCSFFFVAYFNSEVI